jgi:hypothetical protein
MSEFVQFARKSTADDFRDRYEEHLCPIDDDARTKTVAFVSDTPDHVIEEAEAVAVSESARLEGGLTAVDLTRKERERLDFSRDGVNVPKARYLKGLGEEYGLDAFQHVDLAEIDAVTDARPILERANRSTGQGGQRAAAADEAAERRDREIRANAERQQSEGCDHARGHCEHGDPEACEFLAHACGYDEDEVADLMSTPNRAGPDDTSDRDAAEPDECGLSGKQYGALRKAWGGYRVALAELTDALDVVREEWRNAQQAARAVNAIRADAGQDPIHFDALEAANAELTDLLRMASADCAECHAEHHDHTHPVTSESRETLAEFVQQGAPETPVGVGEDNDPEAAPTVVTDD